MNTRIEKDFTFQAAIHFQDKFILNIYELSLSMLVQTESIREQNIAMDRISYFIDGCLENAIFVDQHDIKSIEKYGGAGINVCTLPEEPYDQIIALVLISKLNAIMEDRIIVTDAVMGSKLSDGVRFAISDEMTSNAFEEGWWFSATPSYSNIEKSKAKKDKIVKLFKHKDWTLLGLTWKETCPQDTNILSLSESDKNP